MESNGTLPSAPEINTIKSDSGNERAMQTTFNNNKPYPTR